MESGQRIIATKGRTLVPNERTDLGAKDGPWCQTICLLAAEEVLTLLGGQPGLILEGLTLVPDNLSSGPWYQTICCLGEGDLERVPTVIASCDTITP